MELYAVLPRPFPLDSRRAVLQITTMRTVVSLSLDPQLKKELDKAAKRTGMQKSDIMKQALKRYLIRSEFEALRERSIPFARKAGYYTDEDVFRDFS